MTITNFKGTCRLQNCIIRESLHSLVTRFPINTDKPPFFKEQFQGSLRYIAFDAALLFSEPSNEFGRGCRRG